MSVDVRRFDNENTVGGNMHPGDKIQRGLNSAFLRDVTEQGSTSADPAVSSLDELDAKASILLVGIAIPWHRWSIEVIERHEEPNRRAVVGDQVLQHEEIDVSPEVLEQ